MAHDFTILCIFPWGLRMLLCDWEVMLSLLFRRGENISDRERASIVGFFFGWKKLPFQLSSFTVFVTWLYQSITTIKNSSFSFNHSLCYVLFSPANHPYRDLCRQDCQYPQKDPWRGRPATWPKSRKGCLPPVNVCENTTVPHKLVILEMALTRRIGACRNYEGVSRQANIKRVQVMVKWLIHPS